MVTLAKSLLFAMLATSLMLPATAIAKPQPDGKPAAVSKKTKVTVRPASRKPPTSKRWNGYGFLPGYRQPPALTDWRAQNRISAWRARHEQRYLAIYPYSGYAQLRYGWGRPGIYRGRWNGGSFGPCWTQTPIGMINNC